MKHSIIIAIIFSLGAPSAAFAAKFIATSSASRFAPGDQFAVSVILDAEGDTINAFGGTVSYPANLLHLDGIRDGNSLVNFWVDAPTSTADGVTFAGITPGGYVGHSGEIFSLVFSVKATGNGTVTVKDGQLLRNDGTGAEVPFSTSGFQFAVASSSQPGGSTVAPVRDIEAPEPFTPEIARDPNLFSGKWFIVFSAEDKGSGINRYEVRESTHRIFDLSPWKVATSPYELADQNLASYVYIKAIDNAGNERVGMLSPTHPLPFYENFDDWFILVAVVILIFLFRKYLWKK